MTPSKTITIDLDTYNRITADNARMRESLTELSDNASLVLGDISAEDTGWYYHLLASMQRARRLCKHTDKGVPHAELG